MSKKTFVLLASMLAAGALAPSVALADDTSLAFNVGAVSDYRYRGISQTQLEPALQGGIDLSLPRGVYFGTWASTIKWIDTFGGNADVELDLYAGWKGDVGAGLTLDVGALRYQYFYAVTDPWTANGFANPSTLELYAGLSYSMVTLKYSHSMTNLFGTVDSKGSGYLDLSASFDVYDGWMLAPHVGHQAVKNGDDFSYTDYSLAISKDFKGLVPSLAVVGTDADKALYTWDGKKVGKTGVVLGVKYNF
ncbi:MAG TPA: TorF family putative porin [Ideonella sp.]|jgi:uncharacterized protein (TIGR02001 family)|nr:TorF family putative porin [Ideonella sp.]